MKSFYLEDNDQTPLTTDILAAHGIVYEDLGTDPAQYQPALDRYRSQRGYSTQDEVGLSQATPNLADICAKFDKEHLHEDDEVRFVIAGEGIFDVRSNDDRWLRIIVEPGDLLIVPKDKHHRFLLTDKKHIQCLRLFQDQGGWVPIYR